MTSSLKKNHKKPSDTVGNPLGSSDEKLSRKQAPEPAGLPVSSGLPLKSRPKSSDLPGGNARLVCRLPIVMAYIGLGLLSVPVMTFDALTGNRCHAKIRAYISWWMRRILRSLAVEVTLSGELPENGALIVSNHVSWIDPFVVGATLPAGFLVKQETGNWPVIGSLLRGAGCLFIPRGGNETQRVIAELEAEINDERMMLIYPEATTTWGDEVSYFFPRLLASAQNTGALIYPVVVRYKDIDGYRTMAPYTDDMHFVWHLLAILKAPRTEVELEFLSPIESAGKSRDHLASEARQKIALALGIKASENQRNDVDFPELFQRLRRNATAWQPPKQRRSE